MTEKPKNKQRQFVDIRDVMAIFGIGLQAYGCWLVYPPLAFIVPGVELLALAVFSAKGSE